VEKLFMGWEFRISEFCFYFFFPSVAPAGKYSVCCAEDLPSMFGAGGLRAGWQAAVAC
jgi:hypothetical protein